MIGYDHNFLTSFNRQTISYYGDHPGFVSAVKDLYDVDEVKALDLTISYKGLIIRLSYNSFLAEGLVGKRDLPFIASKAMVGTLSAFNFYYKPTSPLLEGFNVCLYMQLVFCIVFWY